MKHMKDQKKGSHGLDTITYMSNVLIGQDLATVLKLLELRKTHSHDTIKLITQRPINRQLLIENYQYGVSPLRSSEVIEEIYKSYFNARVYPQSQTPQFYKDGKFHDFGGRAKPMELQTGEEYFTRKGFRAEIASFFSEDDWNNLDAIINQHIDIRLIESIEKTEVQDLVEKNEWLLTFKDFKKITCENLHFSLSPKKFLQLLKNKEKVTPDLIDFCSSAEIQGAMSITWVVSKELHAQEQTLMIPQSMTHEWGHFIFEFEKFDHSAETQLCHALFLVHEDEPQAEDLASKIKLMKRVFDRVFPDFENVIQKEFIRYDDEMFISGVKDQLIEQIGFDYPTLKFLGQMASVKPQFSHEKFLARVLLS